MADEFTAEGFSTDFNKEYFTIQIIACQGGIKSGISAINGYKPTIHEIIGALEYYKMTLLDKQLLHNRAAAQAFDSKKAAKDVDARETSP